MPSTFAVSRAFPLALANLLLSVALVWLHNCFRDLAKAESDVVYLVYGFSRFTVKIKGVGKALRELHELTEESFK